MSDPARSVRATTLLASLDRAGLLAPGGAAAIGAALLARRPGDDPPLHLKILSAVGTFLATIFFAAFLDVSGLVDVRSGTSQMVWGAVCLVAGLALALSLRRATPGLGTDILAQTSFTALAVGKVLIVVGAVTLFGSSTPWVTTIALLLVTAVSYPVAGLSLDRFLSPWAVAASLLWEILERGSGGGTTLALSLYVLVATGLAGGLLLPSRVSTTWRPLGFAALAALGTVVCVLSSGHDFGIWASRRPIDPRPIEAILTLSLVGLIGWVAGGAVRLADRRLVPAVVGALALGLAAAPGIVYALGLLILGHARHDRAVQVVGILALPTFLVLWYYGRDMDFLTKSAVLVASGAALLVARGWMAWAGLDRETTP